MGDAGKTSRENMRYSAKGTEYWVACIILASKSLDRPSQSVHQTSSMQINVGRKRVAASKQTKYIYIQRRFRLARPSHTRSTHE